MAGIAVEHIPTERMAYLKELKGYQIVSLDSYYD